MSSEQLAGLAGLVLSLGFSYIPGLRQWFDEKASDTKQAIMGLCLIVVALVVFGLSCAGVFDSVVCSQSGFFGFLGVLVNALVANQGVYLITRKNVSG